MNLLKVIYIYKKKKIKKNKKKKIWKQHHF